MIDFTKVHDVSPGAAPGGERRMMGELVKSKERPASRISEDAAALLFSWERE
jgi:hypothetical protein